MFPPVSVLYVVASFYRSPPFFIRMAHHCHRHSSSQYRHWIKVYPVALGRRCHYEEEKNDDDWTADGASMNARERQSALFESAPVQPVTSVSHYVPRRSRPATAVS